MPSVSKKQSHFMEAVAHNRAFAKKVGVSQKVGRDFANADYKAGMVSKPFRPDHAAKKKNIARHLRGRSR